jgi:hypothetical protein
MRPLLKSLAAACAAAATTAAIAGCGPAAINGLSPAANTSGVTQAATAGTPGTAAQPSGPAGGTGETTASVDTVAPGTPAASSSIGGATATGLSIVMTVPVHHPAQTTAVIAGRLTEPGNGGQPLAGRLVWLERLGAGGWLLFRSHVTGPDGRVVFQAHVVVGAAFRLVYAGTPGLARSVSSVRIVVG